MKSGPIYFKQYENNLRQFYTYRQIYLTRENAYVFDICLFF